MNKTPLQTTEQTPLNSVLNRVFSKQATLKCKVCGAPLTIGFKKEKHVDDEWVLYCSNIKNCNASPFLSHKDLYKLIKRYIEIGVCGLPPMYEIDEKYDFLREEGPKSYYINIPAEVK